MKLLQRIKNLHSQLYSLNTDMQYRSYKPDMLSLLTSVRQEACQCLLVVGMPLSKSELNKLISS